MTYAYTDPRTGITSITDTPPPAGVPFTTDPFAIHQIVGGGRSPGQVAALTGGSGVSSGGGVTQLVDPSTGRPAYTGPNGEGGSGTPQPGMTSWTMPDGRVAYYFPGQYVQQGNLQALQNWQTAQQQQQQSQQQNQQDPNGQQDAFAVIKNLLDSYGLGSLSNWAWGLITQGLDANAVQQQLYQRPEFKARFPAIVEREAKGLPPLSPGDYVNYENQAIQLFNSAGLPQDFYSREGGQALVDKLIAGDTSVSELQARLNVAQQAATQSNPQVVQQLQQLYGVTPGELTAFWLNPEVALPIIQKRFTSAQIAGQAQLSNFGQLTQQQAEMLYNQGVTPAVAQQGFQQLGLEKQFFQQLPGSTGGAPLTQDQGLAAQFMGAGDALRTLEQVRQGRLAEFQGGGSFASSSKGTPGVGSELVSQG